MADFQTRLKQHINLDTLDCYLHNLVSKATRGIFRALNCERRKKDSVNNLEGAITISQS